MTLTKRSHMKTRCTIKKLCKPSKAGKGCSEMFQHNGLAQAKTAETMPQNPTVNQPTEWIAISIQQAASTVTYAQPFTIPAMAPTQPMVVASG